MKDFMVFLSDTISKLGGVFTGMIAGVYNAVIKAGFPGVDTSEYTEYNKDMAGAYTVKVFVGFAMIFAWILCYLLGGMLSKMWKKKKRRKRKSSSTKRRTSSRKRGYKRR